VSSKDVVHRLHSSLGTQFSLNNTLLLNIYIRICPFNKALPWFKVPLQEEGRPQVQEVRMKEM
jgi:hypothetical protein